MRNLLIVAVLAFAVAGCASKQGNIACEGITNTLAYPCVAAANICQGALKLPCYVVPAPTPVP